MDSIIYETFEDFHALNIADSCLLLETIHPEFRSGRKSFYKWQEEESAILCRREYSPKHPLEYNLAAANGSGKDAFIIGSFILWKLLCCVRSRTIVTSSSFNQLHTQTENYIKTYSRMANEMFSDRPPIESKHQYSYSPLTGSEVILFVTNEEGRAEGYHPFPDYSNGQVSIIVNEAKSVPDGIFDAFDRCTYSRYIKVSSPGRTSGRFYIDFKTSEQGVFNPKLPYARKVTAYDCAHISKEKIDRDKSRRGENDPWFRSARLAEFTSVDDAVVISLDAVRRCIEYAAAVPKLKSLGLRAGFDLALGGDEGTFYVFDNNWFKSKEIINCKDPERFVEISIEHFKDAGFTKETAHNIYADHGGIGAGLRGLFQHLGWELTWVTNQGKAIRQKDIYANRGAELYFNLRTLVEKCFIVLPTEEDDEKLITQLSSRYYGQHKVSGRLVLESKQEARAHGRPSPDRADAVVLAFTGLDYEILQSLYAEEAGKVVKSTRLDKRKDLKAQIRKFDDDRYERAFQTKEILSPKKKSRSIRQLLNKCYESR